MMKRNKLLCSVLIGVALLLGACGPKTVKAEPTAAETSAETKSTEQTEVEAPEVTQATQEPQEPVTSAEAEVQKFAIENDKIKVAVYKDLGIDIENRVSVSGDVTENEMMILYMESMLDEVANKSVLLNRDDLAARVETGMNSAYDAIQNKSFGSKIDSVEKYCELLRITPANEDGLKAFIEKQSERELTKYYVAEAIAEKENLQITDQWMKEMAELQGIDVGSLELMPEEYLKELLVGQFIYENN